MILSTIKLSETTKFIVDNRGKTVPTVDQGIPLIATNCIDNRNLYPIYEKLRYVSQETYDNWFRSHPEPMDIILTLKGSQNGAVNLVPDPIDFCIAQDMVALRVDETKIDNLYLFAALRSEEIQDQIKTLDVSGVIPHFKKSDFDKLEIPLPPRSIQEFIGKTYFDLCNKIDLLHRQNKTLEAMAETLFRQWFIEEAKEDWEEVQVKDHVTLNKSTLNKNYPFTEILYLDTGSLTKGVVSELQPFNLKEAPSRAKRLVQNNDVLISTVRPNQCHYGIVSRPKDNLVVSTGFCTITCNQISPYFIYLLLTSDDMTEYLHSVAEGSTSTYPSLKPEDIGAVTFKLPPEDLMYEFHSIAESYWKKIHMNLEQIQTLEQLRDTLLPNLMSGEVRVDLSH
ncbi:restriction endonuclease subunit S [Acinetobacter bereziniae]|uniref:restriction endonuclease subunit S n=1 Tax=Acinetobacter bereziniae TaxID=106648 RepID=UPI0012502AAE|nr:restriction endonuclease subunit S [Acinetobacter bereziniae]